MIRIQVRGSPPQGSSPRSGAVILDIHDLRLCPNGVIPDIVQPSVRFGNEDHEDAKRPTVHETAGNVLLSADWLCVLLAVSPLHEERAFTILSFGSNPQKSMAADAERSSSKPPKVIISQSLSHTSRLNTSDVNTLAVDIEMPSVFVQLSKPHLDDLQLWADDLTQLLERALDPPIPPNETGSSNNSRDPSLIGSRFFAKLKRNKGSGTETGSTVSAPTSGPRSETVVKVVISEGWLSYA